MTSHKPEKKQRVTPGRPTKFDARYIDQAQRLAMLGQTNDEMAAFFGVGPSTLDRWIARHTEFRGALKEGKERADALVAESLYRRALGYSHPAVKIVVVDKAVKRVDYTAHYPPDTTACIFWLKNRQPAKWRDRTVQDVSVDASRTVQTAERMDEALVAAAAKMDEYFARVRGAKTVDGTGERAVATTAPIADGTTRADA